jgi:hypothetical protein
MIFLKQEKVKRTHSQTHVKYSRFRAKGGVHLVLRLQVP